MLPGGVLRVPTVTREFRPDDPEYPQWLPFAQREAEL
ncbi:hypothetical protein SAMN05421833_12995 [Microbispora rosea]|uniref:Uncharacterized protein n=1 Tax=Microbispora rosea TaxID=58117 RepID=A0A1N7GJD3_9ACTN|nr:hypothetical protein SAMN05421833_12995 [Microbispora rosea]